MIIKLIRRWLRVRRNAKAQAETDLWRKSLIVGTHRHMISKGVVEPDRFDVIWVQNGDEKFTASVGPGIEPIPLVLHW